MILFHGGLTAVEEPRIMSRASYRPLDFGTGFYTTTSYDQASRWVKNRLDRDPTAHMGFVTSYEFDEEAFAKAGLTRLDFTNNPVTVDWFRFIMKNRKFRNPEHGYDIVTGPVANDRVYAVILQYEAGFLTEEEAVARLKPYRLADQVLFHTERSLSFVKKVTTEEVPR